MQWGKQLQNRLELNVLSFVIFYEAIHFRIRLPNVNISLNRYPCQEVKQRPLASYLHNSSCLQINHFRSKRTLVQSYSLSSNANRLINEHLEHGKQYVYFLFFLFHWNAALKVTIRRRGWFFCMQSILTRNGTVAMPLLWKTSRKLECSSTKITMSSRSVCLYFLKDL